MNAPAAVAAPARTITPRPAAAIVAAAALAAAVLAFDLLSPRGVADAMVYAALVLLGLWMPWRHASWVLAAIATVLTLLGYALSPPLGEEWIVLTNRALALVAVWTTAFLAQLQKAAWRRLEADDAAHAAAERRLQELQSALFHVARHSELGGMASAIAHELNQPLAAVRNYVAAAQRGLPAGAAPAAAEPLAKAIQQTDRASEVVRGVLQLMRRGSTERAAEDLNALVDEAASFALVGTAPHDVALTRDFAPDLPPCVVNRTQIQQVVLNLVRNAVEALEGSARREITVRTGIGHDGAVEVSVADSGPGLPEAVRDRLFMPFVTTKPRGVGIGLAVSRAIVEGHGGTLRAEPNGGGGAVFRFTLGAAT